MNQYNMKATAYHAKFGNKRNSLAAANAASVKHPVKKGTKASKSRTYAVHPRMLAK